MPLSFLSWFLGGSRDKKIMEKLKIYSPTIEGTAEMLEDLVSRKIPVREEFDETAAENLAEDTARDKEFEEEDKEDNELNQEYD